MRQALEQLLARENQLHDQLVFWNGEMKQLRRDIAVAACPYKIGDLVQHQKEWGDRKLEVYVINQIEDYGGPKAPFMKRYRLSGRKLKKDNTPGLRSVSIPNDHQPYTQPGETK